MNEWINEWMKEWVNEWMNKWMNERMSEWINEWMNEWTNDWMKNRIIKDDSDLIVMLELDLITLVAVFLLEYLLIKSGESVPLVPSDESKFDVVVLTLLCSILGEEWTKSCNAL